MKILPAKQEWIPGIIISVATFVVIGFVMKKYGQPKA